MSKNKGVIFFAYQGRALGQADDNRDAILSAVQTYNNYQKKFEARSWEDYKKTTTISTEILDAINKCEVFVCDLTYFNHNVLFEFGFAIALDKKVLVLLNENVKEQAKLYKDSFLRNIRYTPLINAADIITALQQHNCENAIMNKFINVSNFKRNINDIFYIESRVKNQASVDLSQTIFDFREERKLSLIVDDSAEVDFKPLDWYFQNIIKSQNLIIHLLGENINNHFSENAKNSFFAGLSKGLGLNVLLIAPAKYRPPLDYFEILIQYQSSNDLISPVIDWIEKNTIIPVEQEIKDNVKEAHELSLIKLGVGCEVAEQEKEGLLEYFVETASYYSALKQEKSILVGRKGSGKSAIYIKSLNEILSDNLNFVVSLMPESDELLEDVELAKMFVSQSSRKSFFSTIWKLVIFSKLVKFISDKIKSKGEYVPLSDSEERVIRFVEDNEEFIKLNVFGVIKRISVNSNKADVIYPGILENLYSEFLIPLIKILREYYKSINAKYFKIIILADNLDKTWNEKNDLQIQCELLISLFEIESKIKKELFNKGDEKIEIKEIIFLRKDIFEYILKIASEPDKLITMAHEINWENYPELLRELIENRFSYLLGIDKSEIEKKAWKEFFDFGDQEHPFKVIEKIITRRPRDLIYFVGRLFESAINKNHSKVSNPDLYYAIDAYVTFLNKNLIAETKAEFPEIIEILAKLQEHHGERLEYQKFIKILLSFNYTQDKIDNFVETLFEKNYMIGFDAKANKPISDIGILKDRLSKKRFLFFPPKEIYVIAHAKYYFIKNKIPSPF